MTPSRGLVIVQGMDTTPEHVSGPLARFLRSRFGLGMRVRPEDFQCVLELDERIPDQHPPAQLALANPSSRAEEPERGLFAFRAPDVDRFGLALVCHPPLVSSPCIPHGCAAYIPLCRNHTHLRNSTQGADVARAKKPDPDSFVGRLAWAIENCGRPQTELAEAMGVEPSRLSEWKTGARRPRIDNLELIVTGLGVDAHWLVTGQGTAWVSRDVSASEVIAGVRKVLDFFDGELVPAQGDDSPAREEPAQKALRAKRAVEAVDARKKAAKTKSKRASSGGKGSRKGRKP